MRWLVKLRHYYGEGSTVLGYYESRVEADAEVDRWNTDYQTDVAYVEEWDAAKAAEWPNPRLRDHLTRAAHDRVGRPA